MSGQINLAFNVVVGMWKIITQMHKRTHLRILYQFIVSSGILASFASIYRTRMMGKYSIVTWMSGQINLVLNVEVGCRNAHTKEALKL